MIFIEQRWYIGKGLRVYNKIKRGSRETEAKSGGEHTIDGRS